MHGETVKFNENLSKQRVDTRVQTDTLAQIRGPWVYDFPLGSKRSKRCLCDTVPKDVAHLISFQTKTVSEFNRQ
jgi:hypothetical protein